MYVLGSPHGGDSNEYTHLNIRYYRDIFSFFFFFFFFYMKVYCVYVLGSPHGGDSNEYTHLNILI